MLRFNLDKSSKLTYFDQIKGQLFSAIYCGKINEGDRLPSIRELADDLSVNYKTIRRVYLQLAQEGLLEIVAGSGAFLRKRNSGESFAHMRRGAIFRLLGDFKSKASDLGLSTERLVALLDGYLTGRNLKPLKLAVVDDDEEAHIFARELEMRLGTTAFPVSLEEASRLEGMAQLKESDILLTTSWHLEEVNPLAEELGKEVVEIKPSHQIYAEILGAAQDHNIGIVIRDEKTMHASWEVFMSIYHPSTDKRFWIAPIHRTDLIEKIVEEADLIFVSPMCWDEMRRLTPSEKELKTYDNFISEETLADLRQIQLLG